MSSENLGRPPLFTPAQARAILDARKAFVGTRLTTAQFIKELVVAGDLEEACSVVSMRRLLNGSMFPSLKAVDKDGKETGEFYDYSKVPECHRGRPPNEERIDRETGALIPVFTKRQKKFQEHVMKAADRAGNEAGRAAAQSETAQLRFEMQQLQLEYNKQFKDNEALRREFLALKEQIGQPRRTQ